MRELLSARMSELGPRRRAQLVGLVAIVVSAWTGCGPAGSGETGQPAQIVPATPHAPLLPGGLPEGFHVESASMDPPPDGVNRALLIGPSERDAGPGSDPVIVVGESYGSASIAGPSPAGGETVPDLGEGESFDAYIVDDGPWTWVVFDNGGCIEDCLAYVAGRGVPGDDLISVARGTTYEDTRPKVDADVIPEGMTPLVTAAPADGVLAPGGSSISLRADDGPGRIRLQQVDADAELASLWGFWIDDGRRTPIRGQPGWAGPVGATIEGGDHGRVWVEDGSVVAVIGWDVSDAVLDQVIDGLRTGTPDALAALGDEAVARVPAPGEAACGSAVLTGLIEDSRWIVGLDSGGGGSPDRLEVCTELVTPSGPAGATGGSSTLAPVGSLTVGTIHVGGGPLDGTFVYGAAPPGTATVELAAADGATVALQLSDAGPREAGERWFAGFEPTSVGGGTVIARAADGSELARAPAAG
jgi:hypothetical protein